MDATDAVSAVVAELRAVVPHLGLRRLSATDLTRLVSSRGLVVASERSGIDGVGFSVSRGPARAGHPTAIYLPADVAPADPPTPAEVCFVVRKVCMHLSPHPAKMVREYERARSRAWRRLGAIPRSERAKRIARAKQIILRTVASPGTAREFLVAEVVGLIAALPRDVLDEGAEAQVAALRDLMRIKVWHEAPRSMIERVNRYLWSQP
jgi:hypothetical protein